MERISVKGVSAAAGVIILIVVAAMLTMWGLGLNDPDAADRINAWWVLGGFAALLVAALIAAYFSARKKMPVPASTPMDGTKAVAMLLMRALLLVIGILGLLLVIGSLIG